MIKSVLTGVSLAIIAGNTPAFANDAQVDDLRYHETLSYAPSATQLTFGGENASTVEDVLEARVSAGAYDAQFANDLPEGSAVVARMTYANYDFQPVWTIESANALSELCLEDGQAIQACKTSLISDITNIRFTSESEAERADADVALTKIFLSYAAENHAETYISGKWIEREPGQSEPILIASVREAGENRFYDAIDILDPVESNASNSSFELSTTASYSLP